MKPRVYFGQAWEPGAVVAVVVSTGHPDNAEAAYMTVPDLFELRAHAGALLLDAPASAFREVSGGAPASAAFCETCGHETARTLPAHFPKCPVVKGWPVRVIAGAMTALDGRIRKLEAMAAELRGLGEDGAIETVSLQMAADNRRREWWGWAERLTGKPAAEMSPADIRAMAVRTEAERARE
jgi:hypothetical protein